MKIFYINSPKYGIKEVLLDDEDYDIVVGKVWNLRFDKNKFYVISNGKRRNGKKANNIIMHRLIMNAINGEIIDHKDGNPLNNQKSNLRFATTRQNAHNYSIPKNSVTGYKGVSLINKYRAYIVVDGKQKFLGYYKTAKEAASAYNKAALKHFGEFARLNVL